MNPFKHNEDEEGSSSAHRNKQTIPHFNISKPTFVQEDDYVQNSQHQDVNSKLSTAKDITEILSINRSKLSLNGSFANENSTLSHDIPSNNKNHTDIASVLSNNKSHADIASILSNNIDLQSARLVSNINNEYSNEFIEIQNNVKDALSLKRSSWLNSSKGDLSLDDSEDERAYVKNDEDEEEQEENISPNANANTRNLSSQDNDNLEVISLNSYYENIELKKLNLATKGRDKKENTQNTESTEQLHFSDDEGRNGPGDNNNDDDDDDDNNIKYPLILYGKSLRFFHPYNSLRLLCARILLHPFYKYASPGLLLTYAIILGYRYNNPVENNALFNYGSNWADIVAIYFNAIFSIEIILKCIAFGLWDDSELLEAYGKPYKGVAQLFGLYKLKNFLESNYGHRIVNFILPFKLKPIKYDFFLKRSKVTFSGNNNLHKLLPTEFQIPRAFLRSSWNRIDLLSTIFYWISLFFAINNFDFIYGVRIFKALGALRIMKLTDIDSGFASVLKSLKYGFPQLLKVGFMLLYFWVFFAVLGVQSFRGSFRRQCVWINPDNPNDTYLNEFQFCGGYLEANTNKKLPYEYEDGTKGPYSKGYLCPANSKCISSNNPYNGRVSFDNILNSMELIFVIISANTFTDLMYYTMDSDNMAASIFFIASVFILTIWMANLLIAVLVESFHLSNDIQKKKKKRPNPKEGFWPIRISKYIINFFKKMASRRKMPQFMWKCVKLYGKIEFIFIIAIVVDLVAGTTLKSHSTPEHVHKLYVISEVVASLLLAESIIRIFIYSFNFWLFLAKPLYVYDLCIALITFVINIPSVRVALGQNYNWLYAFQVSRIYRLILAVSFTRDLWMSVLKNFEFIWDLVAFYFVFLILASIIISIYFEGVIPISDEDDNQLGMFSLSNSFISLYAISSTENWTDILYALQQYSPTKFAAFCGSAMLILWFILSYNVVLNIFIALIAESFDVEEKDKKKLQVKHYIKHIYPEKIKNFTNVPLLTRIKRKLFSKSTYENPKDFQQFLLRGTAIMSIAKDIEEFSSDPKDHASSSLWHMLIMYKNKILERTMANTIFHENPFSKNTEIVVTQSDSVDSTNGKNIVLRLNDHEDEKISYLLEHPTYNSTYFFFLPNHRLRRFCQRLVPSSLGNRFDGTKFIIDETNKVDRNRFFFHWERDVFTGFTLIVTIAMVVTTCYFTPLNRATYNDEWNWFIPLDGFFVGVFTLEFVIKTIADGVLLCPNAYLKNSWNRIDFVVLVSMWINFIALSLNNGYLSRAIRGLTALRVLRCITISETARSTFNSVLLDGVAEIASACAIAMTLLFPFAVWGIHLLRGRLGVCNDNSLGLASCYNEFSSTVYNWDILMPRVYQEPPLQFNSFSKAFKSLFEIVSLEGWVDLLENAMNSSGVGSPTATFATPENGIFVILFNFVSIVFILTFFVSLIITHHSKSTGTAFYTIKEKSWLEVSKLLSQVRPEAVPNMFEMSRFRRVCYNLAVEQKNIVYSSCLQIVLHVHILGLLVFHFVQDSKFQYYNQVWFTVTTFLLVFNDFFYFYGKGYKIYKLNNWNIVRSVILIFAFISNIVQLVWFRYVTGFTNITNLFQLAIFLFVIPQNSILQELVSTAVASLPSIASLTYTWFILFLVYAIAMNQIFGMTRLGENTSDNINFRTIAKGLILLFRCSFGEGWNYIMNDLTVEQPFCYTDDTTGETDCGNSGYALTLMMSWNIISMYIFLNMFISLIVQNFSYVYQTSATKSVVNRHEISKFKKAWKEIDPDGVGYIPYQKLPSLMRSFDGPLSFKLWEGRLTINNLVTNYMKIDPNDPYNVQVDLLGLNRELENVDLVKVTRRNLNYRRFIQEVYETHSEYGAVKMSKLLQQLPLYTCYDAQQCLVIDEYVKWTYTRDIVDKIITNHRALDVLDMIITRYKYKKYLKDLKKENENNTNENINPNESFQREGSYSSLNPFQPKINATEYMNPFEDPSRSNSMVSTPVNVQFDTYVWSPVEPDRHWKRKTNTRTSSDIDDDPKNPFA
ncbi:related to Calcium-channel protein CCH1 [Saccharomycodes ludwigii]|uniref:Calcium-channel protein CCH1 n=1 Tax=Saccharomycodes ludwigii TaxID=36035 RepID=A0A376B1H6_9ASCO|nr:related to Calcium-channel protein CCH1 [Saccharomycodes ludwigii]